MSDNDPEHVAGFELKITGTGECRDAEGRLLDAEGNPVEEGSNK